MSLEQEALDECAVCHSATLEQLENAEFLLAQALSYCQRYQRPPQSWEDRAMEFLRLLQQDRGRYVQRTQYWT